MDDGAMDIDALGTFSLARPAVHDHVGWQQTQPASIRALLDLPHARIEECSPERSDDDWDYDPHPDFRPDLTRSKLNLSIRCSARSSRSRSGASSSSRRLSPSFIRENQPRLAELFIDATQITLNLAQQRVAAQQPRPEATAQERGTSSTRDAQPSTSASRSSSSASGRGRYHSGRAPDKVHSVYSTGTTGPMDARTLPSRSSSVAMSEEPNGRRSHGVWPSQATPPGLAIITHTKEPFASPAHVQMPVTPPTDEPPTRSRREPALRPSPVALPPHSRRDPATGPARTPPSASPPSSSRRNPVAYPPRTLQSVAPPSAGPQSSTPVNRVLGMLSTKPRGPSKFTPSQVLPTKQKKFQPPRRQSPAPAAPVSGRMQCPPAPQGPLVMSARASLPKRVAPITPDDTPPHPKSSMEGEGEGVEEAKDADSSMDFDSFDAEALEEAMRPFDQL